VSATRVIGEAPPVGTARLFPHSAAGVPLDGDGRAFLIARLLEEGDSEDLTWLASAVSSEELEGWVRSRGARQLSRRSLRFWALVLDVVPGPGPGDELWPH